jgi:hypothetical protein
MVRPRVTKMKPQTHRASNREIQCCSLFIYWENVTRLHGKRSMAHDTKKIDVALYRISKRKRYISGATNYR